MKFQIKPHYYIFNLAKNINPIWAGFPMLSYYKRWVEYQNMCLSNVSIISTVFTWVKVKSICPRNYKRLKRYFVKKAAQVLNNLSHLIIKYLTIMSSNNQRHNIMCKFWLYQHLIWILGVFIGASETGTSRKEEKSDNWIILPIKLSGVCGHICSSFYYVWIRMM